MKDRDPTGQNFLVPRNSGTDIPELSWDKGTPEQTSLNCPGTKGHRDNSRILAKLLKNCGEKKNLCSSIVFLKICRFAFKGIKYQIDLAIYLFMSYFIWCG